VLGVSAAFAQAKKPAGVDDLGRGAQPEPKRVTPTRKCRRGGRYDLITNFGRSVQKSAE
jgi:hypothetical protein